jgi:hypothetical protein
LEDASTICGLKQQFRNPEERSRLKVQIDEAAFSSGLREQVKGAGEGQGIRLGEEGHVLGKCGTSLSVPRIEK